LVSERKRTFDQLFRSLQNPRAAVNAVLGFSRWFGRVLGFGWPGRAPGSKNGPSPKALRALRRAGRQRLPLPRRASRCRSARKRAPGAADRARRRGVGPDMPENSSDDAVLLDEGQNPHLGPAIYRQHIKTGYPRGVERLDARPPGGDSPLPIHFVACCFRYCSTSGHTKLVRQLDCIVIQKLVPIRRCRSLPYVLVPMIVEPLYPYLLSDW
jgi:hypothetical protein